MGKNEFKCCMCKKVFNGYGNNPDPINTEQGKKCCDNCNKYVIFERIRRYQMGLPMRENEKDLMLRV